jgi:hypothetical protein
MRRTGPKSIIRPLQHANSDRSQTIHYDLSPELILLSLAATIIFIGREIGICNSTSKSKKKQHSSALDENFFLQK